jgi:hypothetical protein
MTRMLPTIAVILAGSALLAACDGSDPAPLADPTSAPTPAMTASPASEPEPESLPALVLPSCDALFTPEEVATLMGDHMELIGDVSAPGMGGYGAGDPALQAVLETGPSVNCTWILPASERGLTVSVMEASIETQELVRTLMAAVGSTGTPTGGESIIYGYERLESEETGAFTEAHYLSPEIWVSAHDGNGQFAPALTQAAMDRVAELNPAWFTP